MFSLLLGGCVEANPGIVPVVTGSHAPPPVLQQYPDQIYAVWSNHPSMTSALTVLLHEQDRRVVERQGVKTVFDEQRFQLTHLPDKEADILAIGAMLGADTVLVANATMTPLDSFGKRHPMFITPQTLFECRVVVKALIVKTGEVLWSGMGWYPKPIHHPERVIGSLARDVALQALVPGAV